MSVPAPERERAERERLAVIMDEDADNAHTMGFEVSELAYRAIAALLREARPPEGELPNNVEQMADELLRVAGSYLAARDQLVYAVKRDAEAALGVRPPESGEGQPPKMFCHGTAPSGEPCARLANHDGDHIPWPSREEARKVMIPSVFTKPSDSGAQPPNPESAGLPRLTAEDVRDADTAWAQSGDISFDDAIATFLNARLAERSGSTTREDEARSDLSSGAKPAVSGATETEAAAPSSVNPSLAAVPSLREPSAEAGEAVVDLMAALKKSLGKSGRAIDRRAP